MNRRAKNQRTAAGGSHQMQTSTTLQLLPSITFNESDDSSFSESSEESLPTSFLSFSSSQMYTDPFSCLDSIDSFRRIRVRIIRPILVVRALIGHRERNFYTFTHRYCFFSFFAFFSVLPATFTHNSRKSKTINLAT